MKNSEIIKHIEFTWKRKDVNLAIRTCKETSYLMHGSFN